MKKIVLVSAMMATMGIGAASAYAESPSVNKFDQGYGHMMSDNGFNRSRTEQDRQIFTEEERQERFDERQVEHSEYREERIQLALDEGWITEEEANERRAEYVERDRLQEENRVNGGGFYQGEMRKGYGHGRAYGCH